MILVTGGTGFIGTYLVEKLASQGEEVTASHFLAPKEQPDGSESIHLDLRDPDRIVQVLDAVRPDEIYHLAAQSFPAQSWVTPAYTLEVNVVGTTHLFEAIKALELDPRVFVACSSAQYGLVPEEEAPVSEDRILRPVHPYGVSKAAKEMLALQYHRNDGLEVVCGRIFNTTGPGKRGDVAADFAERVARAETTGVEALRVGNLTPKRDITDVRDMVEAIVAITRQGEGGDVVNLCSQRAIEIQHIADTVVELATTPLKLEVDPELLRPTDEPIIQGDNTRLVEATGWKPTIPIEQTLEEMLDHARQRLG